MQYEYIYIYIYFYFLSEGMYDFISLMLSSLYQKWGKCNIEKKIVDVINLLIPGLSKR